MWAQIASMALPLLMAQFSKNNDPARGMEEDRKRRERMIMEMLAPDQIERDSRNLFSSITSGGAFNQARNDILSAGNMGMNAVQRQLGQSGLANSGVGLAAIGAAGAAPGRDLSRLTADAWNTANSQAGNNAYRRAGVLSGLPGQVPRENYAATYGAAGLNALLPLLMGMTNKKRGGDFTGFDPYRYQGGSRPGYGGSGALGGFLDPRPDYWGQP